MARRLTIRMRERGEVPLFVLYTTGGVLEAGWESLPAEILALCSRVSRETYDHALHGYTQPLHQQLSLAPKDALKKLPRMLGLCYSARVCPTHDDTTCRARSPKRPWCFVPGGVEGDLARARGAEIIGLWAEGVVVLVVEQLFPQQETEPA